MASSTPDFETLIEAKKETLRALLKARDLARAELEALERAIAVLMPGSAPEAPVDGRGLIARVAVARKTAAPPARPARGAATLKQVVFQVMRAAHTPMGIRDLEQAIRKSGYQSTSKDMADRIRKVVYYDDAIERLGPGKFRLKK